MIALSGATKTEAQVYDTPEIYSAMESVVKELVNLLLPANLMLHKMSGEAASTDGSQQVTVDRADLDSALHLVNHAQLVAVRLRDVLAAAKAKQNEAAVAPVAEEPRARAETRQREEVRRDDARPREEGRGREDAGWRKDIRETVRSIRSA